MVAAVRMEMAGNETLRSVLLDPQPQMAETVVEISGPSRSLIGLNDELALIRELMPARSRRQHRGLPRPA